MLCNSMGWMGVWINRGEGVSVTGEWGSHFYDKGVA